MAAEELIEYISYVYHSKIVNEHEKSYKKVKTRIFANDNKNKCQIKRDHSSTRFSLAASAILYRNLSRLCQVWSGRDGRASKIGRRPIEHTQIALPILAALPLAKTNRLIVNPFPNKPWFLRVCSTSFLKTLWEKEKLLVTRKFSLSHSVFYPFGQLSTILIKLKAVVCKLFQFGRVQNLSFGKG